MFATIILGIFLVLIMYLFSKITIKQILKRNKKLEEQLYARKKFTKGLSWGNINEFSTKNFKFNLKFTSQTIPRAVLCHKENEIYALFFEEQNETHMLIMSSASSVSEKTMKLWYESMYIAYKQAFVNKLIIHSCTKPELLN